MGCGICLLHVMHMANHWLLCKMKWGLRAKPLQNRKWCLFKMIYTRTMLWITYLLTMLLYIHTVFSHGKNPVFVNCVTVLALEGCVRVVYTNVICCTVFPVVKVCFSLSIYLECVICTSVTSQTTWPNAFATIWLLLLM